jgi:hypothetical protein
MMRRIAPWHLLVPLRRRQSRGPSASASQGCARPPFLAAPIAHLVLTDDETVEPTFATYLVRRELHFQCALRQCSQRSQKRTSMRSNLRARRPTAQTLQRGRVARQPDPAAAFPYARPTACGWAISVPIPRTATARIASGVEGRALDPDKPSSAVEFKRSPSNVAFSAVSYASLCRLCSPPLQSHAPRDANVPRACRRVDPQTAKSHTQAEQYGPAVPKPSSDPHYAK